MTLNSLGFFRTVDYGNLDRSFSESLLERADHYFYLVGRKARVIPNEVVNDSQAVELVDGEQSLFKTCLKVATYFTVVLPLIIMALKIILRGLSDFHVVEGRNPNPKQEPSKSTSSSSPAEEEPTTDENDTTPTEKPQEPSKPLPPIKQFKAPVHPTAAEWKSNVQAMFIYLREIDKNAKWDKGLIHKWKMDQLEEDSKAVDQLPYPLSGSIKGWPKILMNLQLIYSNLISLPLIDDRLKETEEEKAARLEFMKKRNAVYNCLAEALYQQGYSDDCLTYAFYSMNESYGIDGVGDSYDFFVVRIAEDHLKKGDKEKAAETYAQMADKVTADRHLVNLFSSFLMENQLDKAAEIAKKISSDKTKTPLIEKLVMQAYDKGDLVKALKLAVGLNLSVKRDFEDHVRSDQAPLARDKSGNLVIGDVAIALKAIDELYDHELKALFYQKLAMDYYLQGDLVKALTLIDKCMHDRQRDPFLNMLINEKKFYPKLFENIGAIETATKAIDELGYRIVRDHFYGLLVVYYNRQGLDAMAKKAFAKIISYKVKEAISNE